MPFLQLKPAEQSFIRLARDLTKKLDALVLCEGPSDAEVLKLVVEQPERNVGVTDCGGVREVFEVGRYVAVLARLSRRLRGLGVVVNADEYGYEERAIALTNSLKAHGLRVSGPVELSEGLYEGLAERRRLLICVMGLHDIPVDKHCVEDHLIKALVLGGRLSFDEILRRAEEHRQSRPGEKLGSKELIEGLCPDIMDELRALVEGRAEIAHEVFDRLRRLMNELLLE